MIKRLRRMKDGVIYGYSAKMAESYGMEIVMCDENNNVLEVIGEVGAPGTYGRQYMGTKTVSDPVKTPSPAQTSPALDIDAEIDKAIGDVDASDLG